jgi:hypothetical protein
MGESSDNFKVVQPWGRDRGHEATFVSEHWTSTETFTAVDALGERMVRTVLPRWRIRIGLTFLKQLPFSWVRGLARSGGRWCSAARAVSARADRAVRAAAPPTDRETARRRGRPSPLDFRQTLSDPAGTGSSEQSRKTERARSARTSCLPVRLARSVSPSSLLPSKRSEAFDVRPHPHGPSGPK